MIPASLNMCSYSHEIREGEKLKQSDIEMTKVGGEKRGDGGGLASGKAYRGEEGGAKMRMRRWRSIACIVQPVQLHIK